MIRTTYREAVRGALRDALRRDSRVFLMGEDVARYGGANACSTGLCDEFGEERVRDTPVGESAFLGAGVGAALGGMRPIVEVGIAGFSLLALEQIVSNAAALRHTSGGQFSVPLVVRMATGASRELAAQHSQSLDNWYAHVPGLKVLTPGTVQDARDMLLTALDDPGPVLVLEHQGLYELEGMLDETAPPCDPWRAVVRRRGRDATVFTWGDSLGKSVAAADKLRADGIDVEVVDMRSLRPLDGAAIRASIARTHRALVVDEGPRTGSIASEILARIAEASLDDLRSAPQRVCAADIPLAYPGHLHAAARPGARTIEEAIRVSVGRGG